MRTLVISDLHLGNRGGHDVLRAALVRERLLDTITGVERVVLLGDTLELMSRRPERTMAAAEPVMRALGHHLGAEREVILVPGNHDALLTRRWALAQGPRLAPSTDVDPAASPALERLVSWLRPARTRVSYPGVWLGDGIWATHGHYLDRHLIPESAVGIRRLGVRRTRRAGPRPIDYERAGRRRRRQRETLPERLATRPVSTVIDSVASLLRGAILPQALELLMNSGLAQVTATLLDAQMRHAGVPAMARVVQRLGIQADVVLFGHVHRRGPIDGERWPADNGTRFINTGSWLYEPLLVDRATPPHGYWPGGAVLLEDGREPRSLGLLDDVSAGDLRPPRLISAAGGGSAARGR
ncbi:MAG TPA: metallophosphoesterase [Solirubrobacteraceae bacterium]|nr:metallophosphoesterase [Solirubrobacteraceae bacterium]